MKLFYYRHPDGNFGDDLNVWFWDQLLPGYRDVHDETSLIGIGSILNSLKLPSGQKLVIGTGSGYGLFPAVDGPEWDVRGVRGPLTCARLGLPLAKSLSDPAILIPMLEPFRNPPRTNEVIFIPHVGSVGLCDWEKVCRPLGISLQSPSDPFMAVIARIAGARLVIAESMHAAIIADAFGVPWHAVAISNAFNLFKWQDWAMSLDLDDLSPQQFFQPLRSLQKAMRRFQTPSDQAARQRETDESFIQNEKRFPKKSSSASGIILETYARHEFKRALKANFRLSIRTSLVRQQNKLLEAIQSVKRDYGIP